ncbi:Proprotein convertase subtilisin/kexin type 5,Proprotein convertase subtilisin/kexin type 4,Proprotein convertase subtilisin/kexin type 6,Furin-like protease 2 [Mytilus edulis]|uniref:Proprotein convertase subtilisin/kexin type 5,Proprotein convertase subtilisin/kexin type 4,Proprotein convertase subtilisin/kexin type 6,Furin-like protease 2 n=1 Tax=Mytilus edulis TaxID=6550 RepID=A0A8S3STI2_MYTED|nr:Proprotein convertase subtilisin/kexin type 5,Proprotein convertase subtilisin/kexin type 4,Proprotein convertase subtilisin/kexin type 6,Furin-like protease 2 [Mytilus edulis]
MSVSEDITDTVVVRLSTDPEGFNSLRRHSDLVIKKKFQINHKQYYILTIRKNRNMETPLLHLESLQSLKNDKNIIFVEQQIRRDRVKRSNDPEWNSSWHLNDEIVPSMRISSAWSAGYNGDGVVIAVVDDGVETTHPDIDDNLDTDNDYDYYDDDDDPSPANKFDSHGTQISGLLAAEKGNGQCSLGVAYGSTILGVRVIGGPGVTDVEEAQSLRHYVQGVDIYSMSWGPPDGYGFSTLGTLATEAIREGITTGRKGKGSIYVWAAGNGYLDDNCNGDGYVNSIYTIGITGAQSGKNAYYSEVCAAALAATYGGSSQDRYLTTTSINSSCTSDYIEGTSYSCPIAAGIISLALQANTNLTWRDVQYIIVLSSDRYDLNDTYSSWQTNGAYKQVSQVLGFGLMNAADMVYYAQHWTNVPEQLYCVTNTHFPKIMTTANETSVAKTLIKSTMCSLSYIEHVTATVSFSYDRYRGLTEIFLVSPSGTESHLLTNRGKDAVRYQEAGNLTWTFMSVHYWGENPIGNWTLQVRSHKGFTRVTLDSWFLTLYGTRTNPLAHFDQCSSTPCENNGKCMPVFYSYSCNCTADYTGANCKHKKTQSDCNGDSNVTDCEQDEIKYNNATDYYNSTDFEEGINTRNCTNNFSSIVCDPEINQSNYTNDNNGTTLDGVNKTSSSNYTNDNNGTTLDGVNKTSPTNCTNNSTDTNPECMHNNYTDIHNITDYNRAGFNSSNCTGSSDDIDCSSLQTNNTSNCTSMLNKTECDIKLDKTNCSHNLSQFDCTNDRNSEESNKTNYSLMIVILLGSIVSMSVIITLLVAAFYKPNMPSSINLPTVSNRYRVEPT